MNRFFSSSRFFAFACALVGTLQFASLQAVRTAASAETLGRDARAEVVDFSTLNVRGTGDLYLKVSRLPKTTLIGFGGKVTTAGKLLEALRQHPIVRTRRKVESTPAVVSITNLNSPAVVKKANINTMQIALADAFKQVIVLPPTQSTLPDGASVCGKHTLCATFFPTYQTTQSPCDSLLGALSCDPGPCGFGTASPCPSTPTPTPVVLGGCLPDSLTASLDSSLGVTPATVGDCVWNPVQTADVTIADSFALDFYEKSADCDANGFVVEVKAGADDGVARTLHMRITQPNPPQQPLAQVPSETMAVCAITVDIVGPKGQTWQF